MASPNSKRPQSDGELIAAARSATGAQNSGRVTDDDIRQELDAIKQQVSDEVREALDAGTLSLYDSDAPLEMAEHLLYLRTAEKQRQKGVGNNNGKVPDKPVPRGLSKLQRTHFKDPTLNHWRKRAVGAYQRFTDNGN